MLLLLLCAGNSKNTAERIQSPDAKRDIKVGVFEAGLRFAYLATGPRSVFVRVCVCVCVITVSP